MGVNLLPIVLIAINLITSDAVVVQSKTCKTTLDCQLYLTNHECNINSGLCECQNGYIFDNKTQSCVTSVSTPTTIPTTVTKLCNITMNTTETVSTTSITHHKACNSTDQCGVNQFCASNRCECEPNYFRNQYGCEIYRECVSDTDCQQFDHNTRCDNGYCKCEHGYHIDGESGFCVPLPTVTTTTATIPYKFCVPNTCDTNQFCPIDTCQCIPGYVYDSSLKLCASQGCADNSDCQLFDPNRVCEWTVCLALGVCRTVNSTKPYGSGNGRCVCSSGYVEDSYTKVCSVVSTTPVPTTLPVPYQYCVPNTCDDYQFCVDNRCQCLPGYVYNANLKTCISMYCSYDYECQLYDKKRVCSSTGNCVCSSGNVENSISKVCNTTVGTACAFNFDCTDRGDWNQVCVDNVCQCEPNYRWSESDNQCSYYHCYGDSECQQYDQNRRCDVNSQKCICEDGYTADALTTKCNWGLGLYWIPIAMIIPVTVLFMAINLLRHRKVNARTPVNRQTDRNDRHVSTIETQAVTIDDPPPPYSRYI